MKFATKNIWHYPPHLRHIATLPSEKFSGDIYCRYGRKCKQIVFWVHRWIPISCDISRTLLWVCSLFSWFKTKSLTVSSFSSVSALCSLPLPGHLSTVSVPCNFFNSLLTPCSIRLFSGNLPINLFAVCPFKYKLFIKIFFLVAEYHVDSWQTLQWRLLWRIASARNWSQSK